MISIDRRSLLGGAAALGGIVALPGHSWAAGNGLVSRRLLFSDPDVVSPRFVDEEATKLLWRGLHKGVPNLFLAPTSDLNAARPVTELSGRGVSGLFLASEAGTHAIYANDEDGDENWRFFSVELATGKTIPLTPAGKVRAMLARTSRFHPNEIVLGHNQRDRRYLDLFRIDVTNGAATPLFENNEYQVLAVDQQFRLRFAGKLAEGNKIAIFKRTDAGAFEPYVTFEAEAPLLLRDFSLDGRFVYWMDSRDRDTAALIEIDSETGSKRVLAEDPRADIGGIMFDAADGRIKAVQVTHTMPEWRAFDPGFAPRLARFQSLSPNKLAGWSCNDSGSKWLLTFVADTAPTSYVFYDAKTDRATELFVDRPKLKSVALRKMAPHVIKSRDGLDLVSYLTLPKASDAKVPLVVHVHGGPAARDVWGFNPDHQWLADRGYAVLSVNYRGSAGFGRTFHNAGNREWGGRMHDDVIDGVEWAIAQGIADPARVGIMGASFGGYEVLVAMTRDPDRFACGVDLFGLSNLVGMVGNVPPQFRAPMVRMIGDPSTADGLADLTRRSPVFAADKVKKPLLIAQGVNDPRVRQTESDQFVGQLRARNVPVIYAVFADEGHGFRRADNRLAFAAIAEAFLAKHLGGRAEPIGDDFKGANFKVVAGADQLPGLPS
jgi:dienelactone hydrolase